MASNEVESRYIVPDRLLFARLQKLGTLGEYVLEPRGVAKVVDTYLDSHGRALTRQGWACRLRRQGGRWLVTLKGPRVGEGVIHTRPESEITLSTGMRDYAQWPQSELREQVAQLCGNSPLSELVTIEQRRHLFAVTQGDRTVASLSLDEVRCRGKGHDHESYMLECELEAQGTPEDLLAIDATLAQDYDLLPEPRSKLRRALDIIERDELPETDLRERLRAVTPGELIARYGDDQAQGERVSALVGQLFDALQAHHGLTAEQRRVAQAAGLLTVLGTAAHKERSHVVARNLALRYRLAGFDEQEQQVIAAALFLRREAVSPERIAEVLPDTFTADERRQALLIAALVRIASALSREAEVTIEHVHELDGTVRLLLAGPGNEQAARRASRRSDLWAMLSATRLEWGLLSSDGDVLVSAVEGPRMLGINPWDTMPTAARKVLGYWQRQMVLNEPGTRLGEDPEALHDMRVAVRRMRSALRLFGPYLRGPDVARVNERLRRTGLVLGAVRDLDVAIARAEAFAAADATSPDLTPLLARWRRERDRARGAMLRYLNGREYARLQHAMGSLLTSLEQDESWAEGNQAVGYLAPRLVFIDEAIVEAYDTVLPDAPVQLLHALRIDCKRLRYGLEFFREVLPAEIEALIPTVVQLQDHLGDLHDQYVTVEMIRELVQGREGAPEYAGALVYREACVARQRALAESFPEVWRTFTERKARKLLKQQLR
ncbi:MAG: CHAD domain-containing protein [Anaerolineales bacterium]